MEAHSSLATCYMKINDIKASEEHSTKYYECTSTLSGANMSNAKANAVIFKADLLWK